MIAQYLQYFKTLAENHPLILHSDEHGQRAFFSVDFGEVLLGSFKNGIREKGIALYVFNYLSDFDGLHLEKARGGFIVMSYYNRNNKGELEAVYELTETIVYQIIARLQHDSNQMHPLWKDSLQHLNTYNKEPYRHGANADYVGWMVHFDFIHVHHMNNYLAGYLAPAIDQSPVFTEGWIYQIEGVAVYKWTTARTSIVIDASEVLSNYSYILIKDIHNEWSNSLLRLSDTSYTVENHVITITFTNTQIGTVWVAGTSNRDAIEVVEGGLKVNIDGDNYKIEFIDHYADTENESTTIEAKKL